MDIADQMNEDKLREKMAEVDRRDDRGSGAVLSRNRAEKSQDNNTVVVTVPAGSKVIVQSK